METGDWFWERAHAAAAWCNANTSIVRDFPQDRIEKPARDAEPCVTRFIDYELARVTVGRFEGTPFPSFAEVFPKRLERAKPQRINAFRAAIGEAIAVGHVLLGAISPDPPVERTPEETWVRWAPRINLGLEDAVGIPAPVWTGFRKAGSDAFIQLMASRGVAPTGKKRGLVGRVGSFYAQAGATLRIIQSQATIAADPVVPWSYERTFETRKEPDQLASLPSETENWQPAHRENAYNFYIGLSSFRGSFGRWPEGVQAAECWRSAVEDGGGGLRFTPTSSTPFFFFGDGHTYDFYPEVSSIYEFGAHHQPFEEAVERFPLAIQSHPWLPPPRHQGKAGRNESPNEE